MATNHNHVRGAAALAACAAALAITACPARADATYDWSRLAGVRRVAFVNPFFAQDHVPARMNEQDRDYAAHLQKLRITLQNTVLQRLRTDSRFVLVPQARVEQELQKLHWTAADLFKRHGVVEGKGWPEPDRLRMAQVARRVGADAVIAGTLYHPASIGDGPQLHHEQWSTNPLNMSIRRMRAHVISPRVQSFMITNEGALAWKDEQMADHPRTKPRTPRTLLLDWTEATQQVGEQLADSLLRMPPPGR